VSLLHGVRQDFKIKLKEKYFSDHETLANKIKKQVWKNLEGSSTIAKENLQTADVYHKENILLNNNLPDPGDDELSFEVKLPTVNVLTLLKDIKNDNESIKARIDSIESDNVLLKSDDALLKSDNALLKSDNALLKSDNASLKNDNALLKNDNYSLKARIDSIESDNALFKNDNFSLKARVSFLEDFVDPVAKRFLFEKVRSVVWNHKNQTQNYKTNRWNACVESLTQEDIQRLHLTSKADLQNTLFSDRPETAFQKVRPYNEIDENASATVHNANPAYVASMIARIQDVRYHALFRCAFEGRSHLEYLEEKEPPFKRIKQ